MPIGTTAAILGAVMAAGAVGSSAIGAHAAGKAADVESQAAAQAAHDQLEAAKVQADAQLTASREANALQKGIYDQSRADLEPWRKAGSVGLSELLRQMGLAPADGAETNADGQLVRGADRRGDRGGAPDASMDGTAPNLLSDFTEKFDPSKIDVREDPGYDFRLQQGQQALDRSLAARGGSLGGAAVKAALRYNQDYASNEYQNAFNRAKVGYDTRLSTFQANQNNRYNRLANLAGIGQTATNTGVAAGQNYASNAGANTITGANNAAAITTNGVNAAAQSTMAGANARASGYMAGANAIGTGMGQMMQLPVSMYYLSQLFKP